MSIVLETLLYATGLLAALLVVIAVWGRRQPRFASTIVDAGIVVLLAMPFFFVSGLPEIPLPVLRPHSQANVVHSIRHSQRPQTTATAVRDGRDLDPLADAADGPLGRPCRNARSERVPRNVTRHRSRARLRGYGTQSSFQQPHSLVDARHHPLLRGSNSLDVRAFVRAPAIAPSASLFAAGFPSLERKAHSLARSARRSSSCQSARFGRCVRPCDLGLEAAHPAAASFDAGPVAGPPARRRLAPRTGPHPQTGFALAVDAAARAGCLLVSPAGLGLEICRPAITRARLRRGVPSLARKP